MKRLAYFAIAALLFAACEKAVDNTPLPVSNGTHIETIRGGFVPESRTAYDDAGIFSWMEGDVIGVLYANEDYELRVFPFSAVSSGPETEFTGEVEDGYSPLGHATYPYTNSYDGYACNDFVYNEEGENYGFRLWGSVKPGIENPLASVPISAVQGADGYYQFKTATGILHFTVVNAPLEMAYSYLETPDDSEAYINGWFSLEEDGTVRMDGAIKGYHNRYNWNVPTDYNQTLDVWFFVPAGTLPVGSKFEVCDGNWAAIASFPFTKEVEVVRNAITEFAPIELEPVSLLSLDDLLGEYEMTIYGDGGLSGGNATPGDIVLEASDDPAKGNVMMTKFAGISGKQYGTFDGVNLIFPKDQIFGENPAYTGPNDESNGPEVYPYLALDFFLTNTGVVDPAFELLERGKIKAVGADYFGFRACTEDSWLNDNHNGSWPWALSFNAVTAVWKSILDAPVSYVKGKKIDLTPNMVAASDVCNHDGQGVPGLLDGDPATYWHSNWSQPVTKNDPTYGIYFDITLDQGIDAIGFRYQVRANNRNSRPTSVVFGVSNDGETWTQVGACASGAMDEAAAGDWVTLPAVKLDGSYRFIRFGINDSADTNEGSLTGDLSWSGSKKCTNMAELELWWADPDGSTGSATWDQEEGSWFHDDDPTITL